MSTPPLQEALGITVEELGGVPLEAQVGIALRHNPRRAHLFVSRLLGKHIPVAPSTLLEAVKNLCAGREVPPRPSVVLGYAETATSLGFLVAWELGLPYLASTRYPQGPSYSTFEESHSHAPHHVLTPEDPRLLETAHTVVLVDDELTTGNTVLATIRALEEAAHHSRYVVVTLLDGRSRQAREAFSKEAQALGVTVEVWAHGKSEVTLPPTILERAQELAPKLRDLTQETPTPAPAAGSLLHKQGYHWDKTPTGFLPRDLVPFMESVYRLLPACPREGRVLVLGAEEFMSTPLLLARVLERTNPKVRSSSTTLSPVLVGAGRGYPVRTGVTLSLGGAQRYAYNLRGYDHLVLVAPTHLSYLSFAQHLSVTQGVPVTFLELSPHPLSLQQAPPPPPAS